MRIFKRLATPYFVYFVLLTGSLYASNPIYVLTPNEFKDPKLGEQAASKINGLFDDLYSLKADVSTATTKFQKDYSVVNISKKEASAENAAKINDNFNDLYRVKKQVAFTNYYSSGALITYNIDHLADPDYAEEMCVKFTALINEAYTNFQDR